jgi:membrane protease YdiL (CAAX protease family)
MDARDPADDPQAGYPSGGRLGSIGAYALAVVITALAVLSQYFVPQHLAAALPVYRDFLGGLAIVYGIPIVAFLALVGSRPLRRYFVRPGRAAWEGLRWYGGLSLLALLVTVVLLAVYLYLDPSALKLLSKPNPVITAARTDPWFWVAFSFAVGFIEETIFRGWVFGYWLARGTDRWAAHAAWTSVLFAGVHVYYGATYLAAAPFSYEELFLLGFAFAAAVRYSGGNLLVVALLHGANDATAFLSILSSSEALALHYGIILVGALIALIHFLRNRRPAGTAPPTPMSAWVPPPPPPVP